MPQPTAEEFFSNIPFITKYIAGLTFAQTLALTFGFPYHYLLLDTDMIFSSKLQLWRLVTNLFFMGRFSINFIISILMLIQNSSSLERVDFQDRTADYVFCLLFGSLFITVGGIFFGLPVLSGAFLMYLIYLYCIKNPNGHMTLFMIPIRIPTRYFPWAFMVLELLMGGGLVDNLMGIIVGHLYFFLDTILPAQRGMRLLKTPSIFYSVFPASQIRVHGFSNATQQQQQQQQPRNNAPLLGHRWGQGRALRE